MFPRSMSSLALVPALAVLGLGLNPRSARAQAAQPAGAATRTVWDAVYTEDQAAGGLAVYKEYCSRCHGSTLAGGANQGAPPLKGDRFMENWREDHLESLYLKTRNTMPRRSEKVLSERETLDVVSYILRENTFPAGSEELTAGTLGAIQIQRKDGPKALPNNSLIQSVGCMTKEGTAWALTTASAPQRVRSSEQTTPEELKYAESKPLGSLSFRLQNLLMLGAFKPEMHTGHKMLAKGLLMRRADGDTISVTELEMLSATCGL